MPRPTYFIFIQPWILDQTRWDLIWSGDYALLPIAQGSDKAREVDAWIFVCFNFVPETNPTPLGSLTIFQVVLVTAPEL